MYLWLKGFKRYKNGNISYFLRKGTEPTPVVFFHGISPGWYSYVKFIMRFSKDTPIILFELEPYRISSLDFTKPDPEEVSNKVSSILHRHGFEKCDIVSHSFGTIIAGWFVKRKADLVQKLVLVDPVCILLALPDVALNFVYTKPKTWFHRIIRWFAAKEPTIAHSIFRNFDWAQNILWLNDLPSNIKPLVSLSRVDEIIPTSAIEEYLEKNGIQYIVWDSYSHAQTLAYPNEAIDKIHDIMKNHI